MKDTDPEKKILITGATGYIGSMLVRYIQRQNMGCRIIALVRDKEKARQMFPDLDDMDVLQADLSDRAEVEKLECKPDHIIHCASVTKSAEMITHPVEVIESIVNTTQNVLELARRSHIKSMVYLSSMEVYGKIDCKDGQRVKEGDVCRGELEVLNVRSCYPLGKRMAENICYSYYKEYGVPVKIARLAQTFGGEIRDTDNRVFAQFARAAENGEDLVLHTRGDSMGNYCDMDDALRGIMTILEKGADGEAYNVVNEENTMTIRQMAELVADRVANGKIKVVYEIADDISCGYAPVTGLQMSGEKLRALGWKPRKTLYHMYRDIMENRN